MALSDQTKVDYTFKDFANKARSSNNVAYYEETIQRVRTLHSSKVWTESIPVEPPSTSTNVVKKFYPTDEGGDGWIVMTMDRAVSNGLKWVALPTHQVNWSSGSADVSVVMNNFIPPTYGKKYIVKVYKGNNSIIPELDTVDYFFDYETGILIFNGVTSMSETGLSEATSIKIKVYQYVGKNLSNSMPSSSNWAMKRGELTGVLDGVNKTFILPTDLNKDLLFHVFFNSAMLFPQADYSFNPAMNTIVLEDVPESFDKLRIVYHPIT